MASAVELAPARPLEVVVLGPGLFRVRSETFPDVWYDVALGPGGAAWCSCPDFEYRGRERECKHARAARAAAAGLGRGRLERGCVSA